MTVTQPNTAVLLVNLGTPDEPTAPAIRRYLKEFLSDPRVVDLPRLLWLPILYLFILRLRPPRLVHNYQLVWGRFDGPIRNITRALARRVAKCLDRENAPVLCVEAAMTYGAPSVAEQLAAVTAAGARRVLVVPLFPQYAGATTGAVTDAIARARANAGAVEVRVIERYPDFEPYIDALRASIEPYRAYVEQGAMVVFSFHGIPMSQVQAGDPYPDECRATVAGVVAALGLAPSRFRLTFQSRFGPAAWLEPYTADTMARLPGEGYDKVLVVCPGFATDCLETIEEIRVQNRDIFMAAGGVTFRYVRALNAGWPHARAIAKLVAGNL